MQLKSRIAISTIGCVAALLSIATYVAYPTQPPSAESDARIIKMEGKHSPKFTRWELDAKIGESLMLSHDGIGTSTPAVKLKPNWFTYIDTQEQAWVYDGESDITIHAIVKNETKTPATATYCLCSYKGEIPLMVKSRVKPAALRHLPLHNQSLE